MDTEEQRSSERPQQSNTSPSRRNKGLEAAVNVNRAPRPANANASTNAQAVDAAGNVRPGLKKYMRIRSDSVGSTRGAFTGGTKAKTNTAAINSAKQSNSNSPGRRSDKGGHTHDPPLPLDLSAEASLAIAANAATNAPSHDDEDGILHIPPELPSGVPASLPSANEPSRGEVAPYQLQQTLPRPVPTRPGLKSARQDSQRGIFLKTAASQAAAAISNEQNSALVWSGERQPTEPAGKSNNRHTDFVTQASDSLQFSDANLRGDALLFTPDANAHGGASSGYGSTHLAGSQIMGNSSAYLHEGNSTYFHPHGADGEMPNPYHGGINMNHAPPGQHSQHPPTYGGRGMGYDAVTAQYQQRPGPPQFQGEAGLYYGNQGDYYQSDSTMFQEQAATETMMPLSSFERFCAYWCILLDDYYYAQPEEIGNFTSMVRSIVYDPTNPEFTSLHQFTWSVLIGIFFGVLTAIWGKCIEELVEFIWKDIPETLLEWGVFTDLEGSRPLPHYMWICPAVFGGFLAWATEYLPVSIPGQNEWIEALHRQGVLDPSTFWHILIISTLGMMSGLSLGPELPLVLLSGMVGSKLSTLTHQSVLSARVMVLTAGSAAIGGFFGFPMAGALFVLEIPHRMGLQYFEALSPATMASIISVLLNRIVTGNEVKGYFEYPFLAATLKSHVFCIAVFYGVVGALFGILYCKGCIALKTWTHGWFHAPHDDHHDVHEGENAVSSSDEASASAAYLETGEHLPLVSKSFGTPSSIEAAKPKQKSLFHRVTTYSIPHEPTRAAVVGVLAGVLVGIVSMFLPHNLFWGEAQLQTLIDKGRTPLPVFGRDGEPTEMLTAWGYCMVDPNDDAAIRAGPGIACSFLLTMTKILVVGVSLGTGIVGGHFWGPLYVGAAASNLFIDIMSVIHSEFGLGEILYEYPCVALLCIMGATHVVTFRAHTAVMLILTLTITAFHNDQADPSNTSTASTTGDYSAVFPLLVVSCFISLMLSRDTVFYKQQRCRGDILASPEVLCEPGKDGEPMMPVMPGGEDESGFYNDGIYTDDGSGDDLGPIRMDEASLGSLSEDSHSEITPQHPLTTVHTELTSDDIERQFSLMQQSTSLGGEHIGTADPMMPPPATSAPYQASSSMFPPIHQSGSSTSGMLMHTIAANSVHRSQDSNSDGSLMSGIAPNMSYADESPQTVGSVKKFLSSNAGNGMESSPNMSNDSGAPPRAPPSTSKIDELLAKPIESRSSSRASNGSRRKNSHQKKPSNHRRIMSGSDALSYALLNTEGGRRHRASSVDPNGQRAPGASGDDVSVTSGTSHSVHYHHSRNSSIISNGGTSSVGMRERRGSNDGSRCTISTSATLVAVKAQGSIQDFQPDLLTQARMRSSSVSRMVPKPDRSHVRRKSQDFFSQNSNNNPGVAGGSNGYGGRGAGGMNITDEMTGALSADAIERSFSSMQHQSNLENDSIRANGPSPVGYPGYPQQGNGRYSPYARGRVGTDPVS